MKQFCPQERRDWGLINLSQKRLNYVVHLKKKDKSLGRSNEAKQRKKVVLGLIGEKTQKTASPFKICLLALGKKEQYSLNGNYT